MEDRLTEKELSKLSREDKEAYLKTFEDDEESTLGRDAADIALSLANDYLLDFGDEAAATIVASALVLADGDSKHWKEYYRMAQQDIDARVKEGRERHKISTFVTSFISPSILSKVLNGTIKTGKMVQLAMKELGKNPATKAAVKGALNKTLKEVSRTAIESGVGAVGRKEGGRPITDDIFEGIVGAGVGMATHGAFKTIGKGAEIVGLGNKAQAASDTLGGYFKDLNRFVGKYKNKDKTDDEALSDLYEKMFNNKLLTHTNIDYDPKAGQFIPRKGQRIKKPKVGDVQRNLNEAIKAGGKELDRILGETNPNLGKLKTDITDMYQELYKYINKEFSGTDRTRTAMNVIKEHLIKGWDEAKNNPNVKPMEVLHKLRLELDKKIKKAFGDRGEDATIVARDVEKKLAGLYRELIDKQYTPANKKLVSQINDDLEDFYAVLPNVRQKARKSISGGADINIQSPSLYGVTRAALGAVREHAGIRYHHVKEQPTGTGDFIIPGRLNPGQAMRKEHSFAVPSVESLAQVPTRFSREMGKRGAHKFKSRIESRYGMEQPDFPEDMPQGVTGGEEGQMGEQLPNPYREPGQAFQPPGLEQVDQMMGQAEQMNRMQMQQEKRQKEMLDKLRMSKLPRNSEEFIQNKELVMAKFAQDVPTELANVAHILSFEPDKIEDMMTIYSMQYPNLFVNDRYKRINGKIIDNVSKNQARKETFDREDIPTSEKAAIIDKINKTAEFTADIDTANKLQEKKQPTGVSAINDVMAKLKAGQPIQKPAQAPGIPETVPAPEGKEATGLITTKSKEGKIIKETPVETLDVF